MSKGFNMIGWRIGLVCGHPKIVQAFADVKDNCDSGQFMAIQQAAAAALRRPGDRRPRRARSTAGGCRSWSRRCSRSASRRRCRAARTSSTRRRRRAAGGRTFANAEEASQFLITEQSVCCVPWDDAGPYLRFSVTYVAADEAAEDALMAAAEERLRQIRPVF